MSRYVVQITGPSGLSRYLSRGKLVESMEQASHYPHPSNAREALGGFTTKGGMQGRVASLIDTRDHERVMSDWDY
jgi:hypothetical protein